MLFSVHDEQSVPGCDKCHLSDKPKEDRSDGRKKEEEMAGSFSGTSLLMDESNVEDVVGLGTKTEDRRSRRGVFAGYLARRMARITIGSHLVSSDLVINFNKCPCAARGAILLSPLDSLYSR